jgi:hypothetical protein
MLRTMPASDLCKAALHYAQRGWPVFPLTPGEKNPLGRLVIHGCKDATCDLFQVADWWLTEPEANIGLPTGTHFDVLDVDSPEALDALGRAGPLDGPDVEGPTVATPRVWHVYVAPTGHGNKAGLGGIEHVDWRGLGGYVVAPPSRKADGTCWEWMTGTPLDLGPDTPIVPAPPWVLDLFDRRSDVSTPGVVEWTGTDNRTRAFGRRALEAECWRVANAPEGTRNDALNRAGFNLFQLCAGGVLDVDVVTDQLLAAARCARLSEHEARRTLASAARAGAAQPRSIPA